MTTFNEWVDAFRGIALASVERNYNEPPKALNAADLPAAWPAQFLGGYNDQSWSCDELNEIYTMKYFIATEAIALSRMPENYQLMIDVADEARPAIRALRGDVMNFVQPTSIVPSEIVIGGNKFFGLICTVEGSNGGT